MSERIADVPVPTGWAVENETAESLTLLGPEADIRVHFSIQGRSDGAESAALAAWRELQPAFSLRVRLKMELPSNDGWESKYQIIYDTAPSERRIVLALVRLLDDRAYVNLVDGTTSAFDRRGAQLAEIMGAWKPKGLALSDLSSREASAFGESQRSELESFIPHAMSELRIPGLSIAIVQDGKIVYSNGFGVRDVDSTAPVTTSTRFMIGSSTKALTTLLMAKLVSEGHVTWETPITDLLPTFRLGDEGFTQGLRLRDTVSASTGMPRKDFPLIFQSAATPEGRIEEMRTMTPTTGAGEVFQYSNLLVAAGGYAAAHAYEPGVPLQNAYVNAMRRLVFEPLKQERSAVLQDVALESETARPHAMNLDGASESIPLQIERFAESVAPAGSAWSTAEDMAQYLLLELNEGKLLNGAPFVSREALLERRHGIKIDDKTSYGLGLIISNEQQITTIGHGGNTLGFTSDMYFLPDKALAVAVLVNRAGANDVLAVLRQKLFEIFFGANPKAEEMLTSSVASREAILAARKGRVRNDPESTKWLSGLVGTFRSNDLGTAVISNRDQGYWAQFESWGSELGIEETESGERCVVLISPPWSGALRFIVAQDNETLTLNAMQHAYVFTRKPLA